MKQTTTPEQFKIGSTITLPLKPMQICREADLLPMLPIDHPDYLTLRDSMEQRQSDGMTPFAEPLAITQDGKLANGRHRRRAALDLGIDYAECVVKSAREVAQIVADTTLARRHFDQGQRAVLICKIHSDVFQSAQDRNGVAYPPAKYLAGGVTAPNSTDSIQALSKKYHVSDEYLRWAWKIVSAPPRISNPMVENILSGKISLNAAVRGLGGPNGEGGINNTGKPVNIKALEIWRRVASQWSHNLRFCATMDSDQQKSLCSEVARKLSGIKPSYIPQAEAMIKAMRKGIKVAKSKKATK